VLQQLMMIPGLPERLLRVRTGDEPNMAVLNYLQKTFACLHDAQQKYYVPTELLANTFMEGRPADCGEQRDAFGFYTCLVDTIDTLLTVGTRTGCTVAMRWRTGGAA
jgi:hypothetical protein